VEFVSFFPLPCGGISTYGDGSKPWYLVNPKIAGKWMFIPLKKVLIGIDPYPYSTYHDFSKHSWLSAILLNLADSYSSDLGPDLFRSRPRHEEIKVSLTKSSTQVLKDLPTKMKEAAKLRT
jgi:hypothetical protein